jgi:uncharacterized protein (DUF2235 family)
MTKATRKTIERKTQPAMPGKRIVIFADGTGNSFSGNESNIWRLAQALDKTAPDGRPLQLMRYVPGVGTSGNALIRAIDGATGFGVPANVRKLYRFLCWNCDPQDQIFLFGFSRGAFTVRTLAAMIATQGLMPREVDGRRVTGPEMARNTMAAWLAYRRATAPFVPMGSSPWNPLNWRMNPLTALVRELRDCLARLKRQALGQAQHRAVLAALPRPRRSGRVKVRFLGLFDTVEAYGMPIKELTDVWDWLVWPIQFRNQRPAFVVEHLRHALALDDERLSFHPIRVDISARPDGRPVPDTQELWFAGMHSDVGGGYPDDETSFEPLLWIAGEAAAQGLDFDPEMLDRYRRRLYPQAMIHDSRAGLASLYRYAPRTVDDAPQHGGAAVIHHSVVAKIDKGANGYAPQVLPAQVRVRPATPTPWAALPGFGRSRNEGAVADLAGLVRRRKGTNWITILSVLALFSLPLLDWVLDSPPPPSQAARWLAAILGGLVPTWALAWVDAMVAWWPVSVPILLAMGAVWSYNRTLGYQMKDLARKLWVVPPTDLPSSGPAP